MLGINNYYTFILGATDRRGQRKGEIGCILVPAFWTWGKEILKEYISELDVKGHGSDITMNSRKRNFSVCQGAVRASSSLREGPEGSNRQVSRQSHHS